MRKNALLAVLIVGIAASLLAPSVLAASKSDEKSSDKQATLFDPFAMQTVAVSASTASATAAQSELRLTRRAIRIPFRPGLRSAFRPVW
jgi:septal ring-binding cell division protein DamX